MDNINEPTKVEKMRARKRAFLEQKEKDRLLKEKQKEENK